LTTVPYNKRRSGLNCSILQSSPESAATAPVTICFLSSPIHAKCGAAPHFILASSRSRAVAGRSSASGSSVSIGPGGADGRRRAIEGAHSTTPNQVLVRTILPATEPVAKSSIARFALSSGKVCVTSGSIFFSATSAKIFGRSSCSGLGSLRYNMVMP
jgi:hypothetical protein